jgi:polyphosphate kinase
MATAEPIKTSPAVFFDRDLSWLEFNRRVLHEALDPRTPLLERVKFLAICNSNLDDFFMKRIARLKRRGPADSDGYVDTSLTSQKLLGIRQAVVPMLAAQADCYRRVIRPELARNGIYLLAWPELDEAQTRAANEFFRRTVFPVLTPLAVDPGHPFPFISNLSTSLGLLLRSPEADDRLFARVKVPDVFPQWLTLPEASGDTRAELRPSFLRLLDIIQQNLHQLFPGMVVLEVMPFRVTRNADIEVDEDEPAENLATLVEEELRQRRFEKVVRLEHGLPASPVQLPTLIRKLGLTEADVYEMGAELDYTDLFPIAGLNRPELHDPPWQPVVPAEFADEDADVFAVLRGGDVLIHHPYESFDATVGRFIRRAADDPNVLAIKMTVYRVGSDTHFLDALVRAAEAGKQVACLVEVTARFDERQNLFWAQTLEKVGVHVVYGVVGLKTHCKTTLVVRQDDDGLRCYAHIGTGNYNVKTAGLYSDLGLLTANQELTCDVVELFHYLTGRSRKREYAKLLVAPVNMREQFLALIAREVEHHRAGRPARIIAKMNQLEDRPICEALLGASQAGLEVDLIVRGFCTLAPGVPGVSDRIRVMSVIGRFLEHSRIYYFQNGSEDPLGGSFFIGSADWMERNLSERVEAIAPIEFRPGRERLWEILQIMLHDHRQAWDLHPDGTYTQRISPPDGASGPETLGTQQVLMDLARKRADPGGRSP